MWFTLHNSICIPLANSKKSPLPDPLFPAALPARIFRTNLMAAIVLDSDLIFFKKNRKHLKHFGAPVVLHYDPL